MGLFNFLFKDTIFTFKPDFTKSEYDNWLEYIGRGGTDDEWKLLKKRNRWKFPKSKAEKYMDYEKEMRPLFNKYLALLEQIEKQWSELYNSKNYKSKLSSTIEKECYEAMSYYEKVRNIDIKHEKEPLKGSKVITRLAMLYERQGNYEKSIEICKRACSLGMDERSRMLRMIKKAQREPNEEEKSLLDSLM